MEEEDLHAGGTETPKGKKYPRDDVPLVRWGFRICFAVLLIWVAAVYLPTWVPYGVKYTLLGILVVRHGSTDDRV